MKVIITGSTGMVGEGVLHEFLMHPKVFKNVLVINRRDFNVKHQKLKEIIHNPLFSDFSQIQNERWVIMLAFLCTGFLQLE